MNLKGIVLSAVTALSLNGCGIEYVDPFGPFQMDVAIDKAPYIEIAEEISKRQYVPFEKDEFIVDDKINWIISDYMKKDYKK